MQGCHCILVDMERNIQYFIKFSWNLNQQWGVRVSVVSYV